MSKLASLALVLALAGVAHAGALKGGERKEIPLSGTATLIRVTHFLPVWAHGQTVKIIESCNLGQELHNAGFLVSSDARPFSRQTNGRLIAKANKRWEWSWYIKHDAGRTLYDQRIEVSFTCLAGGMLHDEG